MRTPPALLVLVLGMGLRLCIAKDDGGLAIDDAAIDARGGPLPPGRGGLRAASTDPVVVTLRCAEEAHPISPSIYGVAFSDDEDAKLGATVFRWGGNPTSRYNPRIGAWNTASDWYFRNVAIETHDEFLARVRRLGGRAAITVPMVGWVAKDRESCSYPVSDVAAEKICPERPDCTNGVSKKGVPSSPDGAKRANEPFGPAEVEAWVRDIRKKHGNVAYEYILDNEPSIWPWTHRDVHPEPTSYDELLQKTIATARAIRKGDPDAKIAGPAEWGWLGYMYSAHDAKLGFRLRPDRRSHGDVPFLHWYLDSLREHERATGERLLDVLDLHFYPQGDGVQAPDETGSGGAGDIDEDTVARRFRATRGLWDPRYEDESYIKARVALLPRMKKDVADHYPGLETQVGEWSFGAERHVSGALAVAEALGRFAESGLDHAFYWTRPKKGSPAEAAFRAFANYDGAGARFEGRFVPTGPVPPGYSVFVAHDAASGRRVAVVLRFQGETAGSLELQLQSSACGEIRDVRVFRMEGSKLVRTSSSSSVRQVMVTTPPLSLTIVEWKT